MIEQQKPIPNKKVPTYVPIKKAEPRKPVNLIERVIAIEAVKADAALEAMAVARAKAEADAIQAEKAKKMAESLLAVKAIHAAIKDEAQDEEDFEQGQSFDFKSPEHIRIKNYIKRTAYIGTLFFFGGLVGIMISLFTM